MSYYVTSPPEKAVDTALVGPVAIYDKGPQAIYPYACPAAHTSEILGVQVAVADSGQILSYMDEVIAGGQQAVILHANVHALNLSCKYSWLREYFSKVAMVFCDGDGVCLAAKILNRRRLTKVTYNVFLWQLAEWCATTKRSLYLLGGRPGVAEQAAERLVSRFPRLRVSGHQHGYFEKHGEESSRAIEDVNAVAPDVLLVCLGMPVQEKWVRDNSDRLAAHVILTGGAALEYGAGILAVVPGWMAKAQLEWLFRFLLEPRRLFKRYIIGNPVFLGRVLLELVRRSQPRS